MPRARYNCKFKELCDGSSQGYAWDNLIDITKTRYGRVPTIRQAEQMLVDQIDNCIDTIKDKTGRDIESFYIGKTYVEERMNRDFDHMDPDTWKLDGGINGRWKAHKDGGYGQDGLIVLTAVTRKAIHPCIRKNKPDLLHEDYALVLERRLIEDYLTDRRLHNKTMKPGRRDYNTSCGYVLYIAFKLKD